MNKLPPSKLESMKILFWNVRGAGSDGFVRSMRDLIKQHRPTVVSIMETRINNSRAEEVIKKLGMPN